MTLAVVFVFGIGVLLAVVSALNWRKRRLWHLVPLVYGAAADLLFRFASELELSFYSPIVFALILYGIAWLMYFQESKDVDNRKRD